MDYDGEKYCKETLSQDGWYLANNKTDIEAMGFWAFHIDTLFFSVLLGGIFLFMFAGAAKNFSLYKPGKLQLFIAMNSCNLPGLYSEKFLAAPANINRKIPPKRTEKNSVSMWNAQKPIASMSVLLLAKYQPSCESVSLQYFSPS